MEDWNSSNILGTMQVLNLMYVLPEDGTDMSKHVRVAKNHTLISVLNIALVGPVAQSV